MLHSDHHILGHLVSIAQYQRENNKKFLVPTFRHSHQPGTHRDHMCVQVDGSHPSQPSQAGSPMTKTVLCSCLTALQCLHQWVKLATATGIATLFPYPFVDLVLSYVNFLHDICLPSFTLSLTLHFDIWLLILSSVSCFAFTQDRIFCLFPLVGYPN